MTDQKEPEEYTGFTKEEVKELCDRFDMVFRETGDWYDKDLFKKYQYIYNPRSDAETYRYEHNLKGCVGARRSSRLVKNRTECHFDFAGELSERLPFNYVSRGQKISRTGANYAT